MCAERTAVESRHMTTVHVVMILRKHLSLSGHHQEKGAPHAFAKSPGDASLRCREHFSNQIGNVRTSFFMFLSFVREKDTG